MHSPRNHPAVVMVMTLIVTLVFAHPQRPVHAGAGFWTSGGPDGGNVQGLEADPFSSGDFYALTRGGVFRSTDAGMTWSDRSAGLTQQLRALARSEFSAGTLWAIGASNLFATSDGGGSWVDRTPAVTAPDDAFGALAVAPTRPGRLYLAYFVDTSDQVAVIRSDDAGLTWSTPATLTGPGAGAFPRALAVSPTDPDRVLLALTENGAPDPGQVYVSTNAGATFNRITCGGSCPFDADSQLASMAFAGVTGKLLLGGSGLYESPDFGASWSALTGTGIPGIVEDIAVNPSDDDDIYVAGFNGVAYTIDGGTSWTVVDGGFIGNSSDQPARSTQVVFDPFSPSNVLAGTVQNGVYRLDDPVNDIWTPSSNGMNAANIRAVAVSGSRLHAGIGDAFSPTFVAFASPDGGSTWTRTNTGLVADQFRDIAIDPNDSGILYAGGRKVDFGVLDANGNTVPANGGIYKSTDSGVTWSTIDSGIPTGAVSSPFGTVREILPDVFSGSSGGIGPAQTLYAGGSGDFTSDGMGGFTQEAARVYKTTDAGASWTASDTGMGGAIEHPEISGFALHASAVQMVQDPTDATGNTLYVGTFLSCCTSGTTPLPTLDNGVFKSTDGGASWSLASSGLPHYGGDPAASNHDVLALAIDPTDATGQTLYATAGNINAEVFGSVYKTTDGGASWSFAGTGLANRDVRDLVVDPATGHVYAAVAFIDAGADGGIYRSQDGGTSWHSISSGWPPAAVATRLTLDNTGPDLMVHTGSTRGVQSFEVVADGDTDGTSDATEDAAPNGGDGNADGTDDADQDDVASLPANPSLRAPAGDLGYVTVVLRGQSGTCAALENVSDIELSGFVPNEPGWSLPSGGIQARIPDCDAAELDLIFEFAGGFGADWVARGWGLLQPGERRSDWREMPGASLDGATWTIPVSDGGTGDGTTAGDSVILFSGGPATLSEVFFEDGLEAE